MIIHEYNHTETSNAFHYQDLIDRRINDTDVKNRLTQVQEFRNETLKTLAFFINRFYLAHTLYNLNDPKFFNNLSNQKSLNDRLVKFKKKLYELPDTKRIDALCKATFGEYEAVADVHIANALMRQVLEDLVSQEAPKWISEFKTQRIQLIRMGVLPKSPALTLGDMKRLDSVSTIHFFIGKKLTPQVAEFDQELAKKTKIARKFFGMTKEQFGRTLDNLPENFKKSLNEACAIKVAKIMKLRS